MLLWCSGYETGFHPRSLLLPTHPTDIRHPPNRYLPPAQPLSVTHPTATRPPCAPAARLRCGRPRP
eukprot:363750-Chlamydomonas_euryale.AAC.2